MPLALSFSTSCAFCAAVIAAKRAARSGDFAARSASCFSGESAGGLAGAAAAAAGAAELLLSGSSGVPFLYFLALPASGLLVPKKVRELRKIPASA